ncbi:MAG TPA: M1 family metallopeptidase [Thermoanaerobaculia bacterium]
MKRLLACTALLLLLAACRDREQPVAETAPPEAAVQRDPHSYSRPDEVRVEHINLDLNVDFPNRRLAGTATLRILNSGGAKSLVLDTHRLEIRAVRLEPGNATAPYKLGQHDPVLGSPLEIEIQPDTTAVSIDYASDPNAKALQWLEPAMTAGKKQPFLLSQSQAVLARTWVPCQDTPGVRFTYDAKVRVPAELLALMSAENPQSKSADGVYQFRMPQPVPSYLLAIAVGDLEFRALDSRNGVYAEPSVLAAAANEFADTPKMMQAAEELYGPYLWGRYDLLVLPPSFPYGGMENPRLTFLTPTVIAGDRSLVALVAHELAHSWSGNLVTNATWNDFWLNEGFTTYFEHRITEQLFGREYGEMIWQLGLTEVTEGLAALPPADQHLYLKLEGRDPDEAPSTVYEKGALFLRRLEETAGRERWDQFLRAYFDAFAFKPMTTEIFKEHLAKSLPDVVQKVDINAWIHGPGLPADVPQPRSEAFAKVEAQAKAFAEGTAASGLQADGWSSHEKVHFIQSLPQLSGEQMAALDRRFGFTRSGNNEVLSVWLQKSVDSRYSAAYPAIERFLTTQGRRKFLRPLYTKLAANPADAQFARDVYEKARPTYHPVSRDTIDTIMKWNEGAASGGTTTTGTATTGTTTTGTATTGTTTTGTTPATGTSTAGQPQAP